MNTNKILILIQDLNTQKLIQNTLDNHNYLYKIVNNCEKAHLLLKKETFQLIIIDDELYQDELCLKIRSESFIPILLIISLKSNNSFIVKALEIGVNDYLVKPFMSFELLKRVRIMLDKMHQLITVNRFVVDIEHHIVKHKNRNLDLTPTEFKMLTLFLQNPNKALSRSYIFMHIYGENKEINERKIDSHIKNLRKKLDDKNHHYIKSVSKVGYKYSN